MYTSEVAGTSSRVPYSGSITTHERPCRPAGPALLAVGLACLLSRAASATIVPGGALATSATWDLAGSPYVIQSALFIGDGVSLTIAAGVQVRLAVHTSIEVWQGGTLAANGTAGQPITFTSDGASPQPGDWFYIDAQAGSHLRLTHCSLAYGGRNNNAALLLRTSDAEVRGCTLHHFAASGVLLDGTGITPLIADTTVTTTTGYALYQNTLNMSPQYSNLTLTGSGTNALAIDGEWVSGTVTIDGSSSCFSGGTPILLLRRTISVPAAATLTIAPGTDLRPRRGGWFELLDGGTLRAEGTPSEPIVIRADTATPHPGDWYYINAQAGSHLRLAHCDLGYAGMDGYPALYLRTSDAQLSHLRVHHGAGNGIILVGAGITPSITDSSIESCGANALSQTTLNMQPVYRNLTLTGNGTDALVLPGGGVDRAVTLDGGPATFNGRPIVFEGAIGVNAGGTLVVAPNTTLKLPIGGSITLADGATLVAEGSAGAPILFDSVATAAQAGDWFYIDAQAGSHLRLAHCDVGHGGRAGYPTLYLQTADAQLSHVRVHDGAGNGMALVGAGITPTIADTTVEACAGRAVTQTTLNMQPVYRNVTLAGNGTDALVLPSESVTRAVTLDGSAAAFNGKPLIFDGSFGVAAGGTLTIVPGTVLKLPIGALIDVVGGGSLIAEGGAAAPIVFTSVAPAPAPGDWFYIHTGPASQTRLGYCEITAAGRAGYGAVLLEDPTGAVSLANCTVHGNAGPALRIANDARPLLKSNQLFANGTGVNNVNPRLYADARLTWWGDPSGPYHPTLNPGGKGNAVSDKVLFVPWLEDPNGTVLSQVFVQLDGPSFASAGETSAYAISYYAGAAVRNAVLVLTLPPAIEFVDATGSGLYWMSQHEVFWRLGDLAVGAQDTLSVRGRFVWGLAGGSPHGAWATLAGADFNADELDITPYLNYDPPVVTGESPMVEAEITAERQAFPDLDTLYARALSEGFELWQGSRVTIDSDAMAVMIFMRKPYGAALKILSRRGNQVQAMTWAGPLLTAEDASGGMSFNTYTRSIKVFGEWSGLSAEALELRVACNWGSCHLNCLTFALSWEATTAGAVFLATCLIPGLPTLSVPAAAVYAGVAIAGDLWACNWTCAENPWRFCCTHDLIEPLAGSIDCWVARCDVASGKYDSYGRRACEKASPTLGNPGTQCYSYRGCRPCNNPTYGPPNSTSQACRVISTRVARDPNAKYGVAGDVLPGQLLDYTVEYENVGEGRAYGVYVTDTLGPHIDESTVSIRGAGRFIPSLRQIVWDVGELAPKGETGSKGQVGFSARLHGGLPGGTTITNQAIVYFPSVPEETPTNTVVNVIMPVVVQPRDLETEYMTPLAILLAGTDVGGSPLAFAVTETPLGGQLTGTPPNVIYTPAADFVGVDRFTFTASNGLSTSRPAEVRITVKPSAADTVRPRVYWTFPADGERVSDIALRPVGSDALGDRYAPSLQVQASEPLDPTSVTVETVAVVDGAGNAVPRSVRFDESARRIEITPRVPWRRTTYMVTIGIGVKDRAGNALTAPYAFSFTGDPPSLIRERIWSQP